MDINYRWKLQDVIFSKDKGKVFSCFACGGGSTMGYKLAGFDVLGCNEIDPKMIEVYKSNHSPKYAYLEPIQTFKLRNDLPKELYELDILDGSPPCSSFSMAGNREKDWGKEKIFSEGQSLQILDTLFFDFIDLADKLRPKVVIAENVKGLLMGGAKEYVRQIYVAFDKAGYFVQHFLLNSKNMGVPQKRERVFFIALRKDLATPFLIQKDFFTIVPQIEFRFKEKPIPFKMIEEKGGIGVRAIYPSIEEMWHRTDIGDQMVRKSKMQAIGHYKINPNEVLPTIIAHKHGSGGYHYEDLRSMSKLEFCLASSFPVDYDFGKEDVQYLVGMSVPPLMVAKIAQQIYQQWRTIFQ